jgi:hypothetical protein
VYHLSLITLCRESGNDIRFAHLALKLLRRCKEVLGGVRSFPSAAALHGHYINVSGSVNRRSLYGIHHVCSKPRANIERDIFLKSSANCVIYRWL